MTRHIYISANLSTYDAISAFDDLKELYWYESNNFHFKEGDIVYIYVTPYYNSLAIKAKVVKANVPYEQVDIDDSKYWVTKRNEDEIKSSIYAKLSLDSFIKSNFNVDILPGLKQYRKEIKDENILHQIESSIVKRSQTASIAFDGVPPNVVNLKKIVIFTGTNGIKYFTTRGRKSVYDEYSHEQICDMKGMIVTLKTHKISQMEIARNKLKELGVPFKISDNTNYLIRTLEKHLFNQYINQNINIKKEFIEFITKDYHQSSYKYTFLISMLLNVNENGEVDSDKLVKSFSQFYVDRINEWLMPEKYETQTKQSIEYWSNFNKMESLIFEPDLSYSSFNKRNFVYRDLNKNIVYFNKNLWQDLSISDREAILNDQIFKRNIYFNSDIFKKHNQYTIDAINEDIKEINENSDLSSNEKEVYSKARVGQGKYRKQLLDLFKNKCAVTSLDLNDLLIASHIKPWAFSNNEERIDKYNGLLLSSNFDKLFDRGLISFDDNGNMIISSVLKLTHKQILQLEKYSKINVELNDKQKEYLNFHRNKIFIK